MFPPHVLREYAFLADGERGALVGPRGDVVWMCAPRWDSEGVFSSLIGGCGAYAITPAGRFVWGGYYEQGSLIWRSRWITETGIIECRGSPSLPRRPAPGDPVAPRHRRAGCCPGPRRAGTGRRVRSSTPARATPRRRRPVGRSDRRLARAVDRRRGRRRARRGPARAVATSHSDAARSCAPRPDPGNLRHHAGSRAAGCRPAAERHRGSLARSDAEFRREYRHPRCPALLCGAARVDQLRWRHGRRGHHEPAGTRRGGPQLRLPLRLDP